MVGWQRDGRNQMADQGKSVDYQTESSNAVLKGPTPLKPVEVKFALSTSFPQEHISRDGPTLKGFLVLPLHG